MVPKPLLLVRRVATSRRKNRAPRDPVQAALYSHAASVSTRPVHGRRDPCCHDHQVGRHWHTLFPVPVEGELAAPSSPSATYRAAVLSEYTLSLIHISEP